MFETAFIQKKFGMEHDPSMKMLEGAVKACCEHYNIKVLSEAESHEVANSNTLFVALGGDGTMLSTARRSAETGSYVVGFNMGHLGFLTEFAPESIADVFKKIVDDDGIKIEERTMLDCFVKEHRESKTYCHVGTALNEVTVSNLLADSIIRYQLHIGETGMSKDNAGEHASNSIIVSTPTGSTAYALNAGGPIISPAIDVMQVVPVAALGMTNRPIIVGGNASIIISLQPGHGEAGVKCDGRRIDLGSNTIIKIRRHADKRVKIIHDESWNFYKTLTEKLHWNRRLF